MWETLSGSIFLRFANPGFYDRLLEEHRGKTSTSTEDIEKDLHRSLPEYAGYQSEDGIKALRRVLQAYSFMNPELGYCQARVLLSEGFGLIIPRQAMNIIAAAILMHAFFYHFTAKANRPTDTCQKSKRSGSSMYFVAVCFQAITRTVFSGAST